MAEYDRIQKKQERMAVANNCAGSKQLKGFVDNRKSLFDISHNNPLQLTKWKWISKEQEWEYFSDGDKPTGKPKFIPGDDYNGMIYDTDGGGWEGDAEPIVEVVEPDKGVVEYHTDELKSFMETDSDIQGTIGNILAGSSGTSQKYQIDGEKVFHKHVTGSDAIAYKWDGEKLVVMGWGVKSDSASKGTGGYEWSTKPK